MTFIPTNRIGDRLGVIKEVQLEVSKVRTFDVIVEKIGTPPLCTLFTAKYEQFIKIRLPHSRLGASNTVLYREYLHCLQAYFLTSDRDYLPLR